jgi:hypothetical protein
VEVDERARGEPRQQPVEQQVDVAARHRDVAGVDEQHVAGAQPRE